MDVILLTIELVICLAFVLTIFLDPKYSNAESERAMAVAVRTFRVVIPLLFLFLD